MLRFSIINYYVNKLIKYYIDNEVFNNLFVSPFRNQYNILNYVKNVFNDLNNEKSLRIRIWIFIQNKWEKI